MTDTTSQRPPGPAPAADRPKPQAVPNPAPAPRPNVAAADAPRPPVRPARSRRRHVFLLFSFLLVACAPIFVTAYYMYTFAADQYASSFAFSVRSEEQRSAVELLGGITELAGSSSSDTDVLHDYLTSQELVEKVNERVDLGAIWSKVPPADDPIFAYDPEGTIEDLVEHWERKLTIVYDSGTRIIELRVLAFDPDDAQRIARVILEESTQMINELSDIAREDTIRFAREELDRALERLREARADVQRFRNRTQIVDPTIDTQNQMGVLVNLQQQLAEALIDLDLLRRSTNDNDPRVAQANRRVEVIRDQIEAERQKLGFGASGQESGTAIADLVGEYESLVVEREFAETTYTSALAQYDAALAEARRQSRYLAAHRTPTLAQKAQYPERLRLVLLVAMFSLIAWSIFCLLYYSLRDRA
ncbi:MAG: capsule biosynthesis protein [Pseudomonadota bacterium]